MNLRFQIHSLRWTLFLVLFARQSSPAATNNDVLTTAAEILSLTSDQAVRSIRISVTGVVTIAEANWKGRFFVQDSTAGVFVNNEKEPVPAPGDLVRVSGASHVGGYAPDIIDPHWEKLGSAALPEAKPVSVERLMSGAEDGQRVEVSGVVRSAQMEERGLVLDVVSGGYRFRALSLNSTNLNPKSLVGATLRLRGTAAATFNFPTRQLLNVVLFVPQESDFITDQVPEEAMVQAPLIPLSGVAQYRRNLSPDTRIRVKGIVTYQRPGKDIFLHDETGGLQVKCRETNVYAPGEIVEAIGFPVVENFLPVLQDAILSRKNRSESPVVPQKASIPELLEGRHHSDVVSLQGKLLDRSLRPVRIGDWPGYWTMEYSLTLQSSNFLISVEAPATRQFAELAVIPIGSTLEVSGICLLQARDARSIESVQLLPFDAANISILQRPSWWTAERLLIGLGILLVVSLLGTIWSIMILRKNSALKSSIAEKLIAQEELKKAHDLLESRVEERTKELNFEMSARKEAEVRVAAIVAERKRIAQELHDTLLQGFTGIGLKLEALTCGLPPSLPSTKAQLEKILEQSDEYMTEARRSVWKLRSPSLEKHADLPTSLRKVSERALEGTAIRLNFSVEGTARNAEHDIEGNLLRICEEAVANAAKHANPTQVDVNLQYAAKELLLRIRDNGCGFNPNGPDGSKAGHFGLVGIRERTRSLAGKVSLNSRPGQGTDIMVCLPA